MITKCREKIKKFDGIWRNNGMVEEWKNARRRQNTRSQKTVEGQHRKKGIVEVV